MRPLNRLATIANRRPAADRVPSMVSGMPGRYTPSRANARIRPGMLLLRLAARGGPTAGHRHALDDLDAKALERRDLAIAPHHEPDPLQAEIGEHLSAEAEVAQGLARVGERGDLVARALEHVALERRPQPGPAAVDDVEQDADAGLIDRL